MRTYEYRLQNHKFNGRKFHSEKVTFTSNGRLPTKTVLL